MGQVVALRHGSVLKEKAVQETLNCPTQLAKDTDWIALLQRIGAGDQSAVAELYDATSNVVFGLALRVLGERAAAYLSRCIWSVMSCSRKCGPSPSL